MGRKTIKDILPAGTWVICESPHPRSYWVEPDLTFAGVVEVSNTKRARVAGMRVGLEGWEYPDESGACCRPLWRGDNRIWARSGYVEVTTKAVADRCRVVSEDEARAKMRQWQDEHAARVASHQAEVRRKREEQEKQEEREYALSVVIYEAKAFLNRLTTEELKALGVGPVRVVGVANDLP